MEKMKILGKVAAKAVLAGALLQGCGGGSSGSEAPSNTTENTKADTGTSTNNTDPIINLPPVGTNTESANNSATNEIVAVQNNLKILVQGSILKGGTFELRDKMGAVYGTYKDVDDGLEDGYLSIPKSDIQFNNLSLYSVSSFQNDTSGELTDVLRSISVDKTKEFQVADAGTTLVQDLMDKKGLSKDAALEKVAISLGIEKSEIGTGIISNKARAAFAKLDALVDIVASNKEEAKDALAVISAKIFNNINSSEDLLSTTSLNTMLASLGANELEQNAVQAAVNLIPNTLTKDAASEVKKKTALLAQITTSVVKGSVSSEDAKALIVSTNFVTLDLTTKDVSEFADDKIKEQKDEKEAAEIPVKETTTNPVTTIPTNTEDTNNSDSTQTEEAPVEYDFEDIALKFIEIMPKGLEAFDLNGNPLFSVTGLQSEHSYYDKELTTKEKYIVKASSPLFYHDAITYVFIEDIIRTKIVDIYQPGQSVSKPYDVNVLFTPVNMGTTLIQKTVEKYGVSVEQAEAQIAKVFGLSAEEIDDYYGADKRKFLFYKLDQLIRFTSLTRDDANTALDSITEAIYSHRSSDSDFFSQESVDTITAKLSSNNAVKIALKKQIVDYSDVSQSSDFMRIQGGIYAELLDDMMKGERSEEEVKAALLLEKIEDLDYSSLNTNTIVNSINFTERVAELHKVKEIFTGSGINFDNLDVNTQSAFIKVLKSNSANPGAADIALFTNKGFSQQGAEKIFNAFEAGVMNYKTGENVNLPVVENNTSTESSNNSGASGSTEPEPYPIIEPETDRETMTVNVSQVETALVAALDNKIAYAKSFTVYQSEKNNLESSRDIAQTNKESLDTQILYFGNVVNLQDLYDKRAGYYNEITNHNSEIRSLDKIISDYKYVKNDRINFLSNKKIELKNLEDDKKDYESLMQESANNRDIYKDLMNDYAKYKDRGGMFASRSALYYEYKAKYENYKQEVTKYFNLRSGTINSIFLVELDINGVNNDITRDGDKINAKEAEKTIINGKIKILEKRISDIDSEIANSNTKDPALVKLESDRDTYAAKIINYNSQIAVLEAPKYESWAKSFVIPGNNEASVENINTDLVNNLSEFIVAYSDTDTFDKDVTANEIISFVNSLSVAEGKELTDYLKSLNSDSLIVSEGVLVAWDNLEEDSINWNDVINNLEKGEATLDSVINVITFGTWSDAKFSAEEAGLDINKNGINKENLVDVLQAVFWEGGKTGVTALLNGLTVGEGVILSKAGVVLIKTTEGWGIKQIGATVLTGGEMITGAIIKEVKDTWGAVSGVGTWVVSKQNWLNLWVGVKKSLNSLNFIAKRNVLKQIKAYDGYKKLKGYGAINDDKIVDAVMNMDDAAKSRFFERIDIMEEADYDILAQAGNLEKYSNAFEKGGKYNLVMLSDLDEYLDGVVGFIPKVMNGVLKDNKGQPINGTYSFIIKNGKLVVDPNSHIRAAGYLQKVDVDMTVDFAGEIKFKDGIPVNWNKGSGHFRSNNGGEEKIIDLIKDKLDMDVTNLYNINF